VKEKKRTKWPDPMLLGTARAQGRFQCRVGHRGLCMKEKRRKRGQKRKEKISKKNSAKTFPNQKIKVTMGKKGGASRRGGLGAAGIEEGRTKKSGSGKNSECKQGQMNNCRGVGRKNRLFTRRGWGGPWKRSSQVVWKTLEEE